MGKEKLKNERKTFFRCQRRVDSDNAKIHKEKLKNERKTFFRCQRRVDSDNAKIHKEKSKKFFAVTNGVTARMLRFSH